VVLRTIRRNRYRLKIRRGESKEGGKKVNNVMGGWKGERRSEELPPRNWKSRCTRNLSLGIFGISKSKWQLPRDKRKTKTRPKGRFHFLKLQQLSTPPLEFLLPNPPISHFTSCLRSLLFSLPPPLPLPISPPKNSRL